MISPKGTSSSGVEIRDPRFVEVVGASLTFARIGTGFLFTEGPLWNARDQVLLFSDMPGNQIRRWSEKTGVEIFRKPSSMANGLTWDNEGRLLACEHATSRVTRTERDGSLTVIASHLDGKELNSPNDIVVKRDGGIYFTDPTYGRAEFYGVKRDPVLDFRGVYRAEPDGQRLTLLAGDFGQPNGLCFSSDEKRLFVNDTERQHVRVFDVKPDGTLGGGDVWAETTGEGAGAPDGMKIDSGGNLYTCGPGGIHVFDAHAKCLGVIQVPEYTANFNWGGPGLKTLFITASTSVYRIPVKVAGRGY